MALLSQSSTPLHQSLLTQNVFFSPDIPGLDLPPVDYSSLFSELVLIGAPPEVASELCASHKRRISELSSKFLDVHARTCSELLSLWHHTSQGDTIYFQQSKDQLETAYRQTLLEWKEHLLSVISTHFSPSEGSVNHQSGKLGFNYAFVPALEKFFSENPNPSHADKAYLAKQGGMKFRQIHIWFQNQRRRSKKATSNGDRTPPPENPLTPEKSVETPAIPSSTLRCKASRTNSSSILSKSYQHIDLKPFLPSCAPPYAFPRGYPHGLDLQPFPCRLGDMSFPQPNWIRQPSQNCLVSSQSSRLLNVDSLVESFRCLSIEEDTSYLRSFSSSESRPSIFEPGGSFRRTSLYPPPAPLPSLIGPLSYLLPDQSSPRLSSSSPKSWDSGKVHNSSMHPMKRPNKRLFSECGTDKTNRGYSHPSAKDFGSDYAAGPPPKRKRQMISLPKRVPLTKPKTSHPSAVQSSASSNTCSESFNLSSTTSSTPSTPMLISSVSSRSTSFSSVATDQHHCGFAHEDHSANFLSELGNLLLGVSNTTSATLTSWIDDNGHGLNLI